MIEEYKTIYNPIIAPAGAYVSRNRFENILQDLFEENTNIVNKLNQVIRLVNRLDPGDEGEIAQIERDIADLKDRVSSLETAIGNKQDALSAGSNIQINDNIISATDTKYDVAIHNQNGLLSYKQYNALRALININDEDINEELEDAAETMNTITATDSISRLCIADEDFQEITNQKLIIEFIGHSALPLHIALVEIKNTTEGEQIKELTKIASLTSTAKLKYTIDESVDTNNIYVMAYDEHYEETTFASTTTITIKLCDLYK